MNQKKINSAIRLIRIASDLSINQFNSPLELCYSGGKDSDVLFALCRMADVPFTAIHKVTGIDPPGTVLRCKQIGCELITPTVPFFSLIDRYGYPSRKVRFCCRFLKEYKVRDVALVGVRRAESAARSVRYSEHHQCRFFRDNSYCQQFYPILDWTDYDLLEFINYYGLSLHPLYYGSFGSILIKKRLGCVGCPLASSNHRRREFQMYPFRLIQWLKHGQFHFNTYHPNRWSKFPDIFHVMFFELFCRSIYDYNRFVFRGSNIKQYLQDFFHNDLIF